MEWILVTNDDGVDAPGLPFLIEAMGSVAPVRTVVPDRERSWIGKAITRFDPIDVERVERNGHAIHAATGYPADCAQLGIHTLFDTPPTLVVSGINLGYNHGAAYLQSSGTVGAALEAAIAGVPAIAASTGTLDRPWREWRVWAETPDSTEMWQRLAELTASLAANVLGRLAPGTLLSLNIPDDADETTERRLTTVAPVGYDALFAESAPGVYTHDFHGALRNEGPLEGSDVAAAAEGVISITPLRGTHDTPLDPSIRDLLVDH